MQLVTVQFKHASSHFSLLRFVPCSFTSCSRVYSKLALVVYRMKDIICPRKGTEKWSLKYISQYHILLVSDSRLLLPTLLVFILLLYFFIIFGLSDFLNFNMKQAHYRVLVFCILIIHRKLWIKSLETIFFSAYLSNFNSLTCYKSLKCPPETPRGQCGKINSFH